MSPIQAEQEKEPEEMVLPRCASLAGDNGSWARREAKSQPSPGMSVSAQLGQPAARAGTRRNRPGDFGTGGLDLAGPPHKADAQAVLAIRGSGLGLELPREARSQSTRSQQWDGGPLTCSGPEQRARWA